MRIRSLESNSSRAFNRLRPTLPRMSLLLKAGTLTKMMKSWMMSTMMRTSRTMKRKRTSQRKNFPRVRLLLHLLKLLVL